jgi:hypothetical protein
MSDDENEYTWFELPNLDINKIFDPHKSHCPNCGKLLTTNRTAEYITNESVADKGWYFVVRQRCLNPDCPFEMQVLDGEASADDIHQ